MAPAGQAGVDRGLPENPSAGSLTPQIPKSTGRIACSTEGMQWGFAVKVYACEIHDCLMSVDAPIEAPDKLANGHPENIAYPEECSNGNRSSRFYLLPVPCRKAKRNHVFLAKSFVSAQLADSLAQGSKELCLIHHTCGCRIATSKNTTSRLAGTSQVKPFSDISLAHKA